MRLKPLLLSFLVFAPLPPPPVMGESAAAVLTAGSGPYQEAFLAFQAEYGGTVTSYDLSVSVSVPREKIIVAFGGKAAILEYPETAMLVYCMAPGINDRPARRGRTVAVSMVPEPGQALRTILRIQPAIGRLAVFHTSDAYGSYVEALAAEGKRLDINILSARVQSGEEIPAELRRLLREMDAFWLLPDPLLVNRENFTTLRYFSRANHIPFYAPTSELARKGATAAVYNSFSEIGRAAAKAARAGPQGNSALLYPEKISYSINAAESGDIRFNIPADVLEQAEALFK